VAESTTVATQIDLALHGQRPPARVTHRIRFRLPRDPTATESPDDLQPTGNDVSITEALFPGRVVRGPVVRISRKRPMVIASPLAGAGWWNANGCCGETTPHRQFLLPTNGEWVQPERFAIDWVQLRNGRLAAGDGSRIDQYPCYGSPLLAVAPGRVVDVVRGYHDIPPHATPLLRRPSDFGGNQIYIRLRRGVYAMYAHIRPGSIRVHEGERVNRGEQIAELGNTGNTTAPHLHFALMDATKPLSANSLPFEIHHFHLQGTVTGALSPVRFKIHPTPRDLRDAHPLFPDVFDFGAAAAARPR
jgi:hypothetical protein